MRRSAAGGCVGGRRGAPVRRGSGHPGRALRRRLWRARRGRVARRRDRHRPEAAERHHRDRRDRPDRERRCRHERRALRGRTAPQRLHLRTPAAIAGDVDGRRLGGMPRRRTGVLALRQDRGHGARARNRPPRRKAARHPPAGASLDGPRPRRHLRRFGRNDGHHRQRDAAHLATAGRAAQPRRRLRQPRGRAGMPADHHAGRAQACGGQALRRRRKRCAHAVARRGRPRPFPLPTVLRGSGADRRGGRGRSAGGDRPRRRPADRRRAVPRLGGGPLPELLAAAPGRRSLHGHDRGDAALACAARGIRPAQGRGAARRRQERISARTGRTSTPTVPAST